MNVYRRFLPYATAIASTALALALSLYLENIINRTIGIFFYIAIIVTSLYGGLKPGIVAIVLSVLALDFYFIPPSQKFGISESEDLIQLFLFTVVSLVINLLTANLRVSKRNIEQLNRKLIKDNADQLRSALNAAQMGLWDWNLVTGEISWSPEHEQLFGLSSGSFDGRYETFDALLHPDDRSGLNWAVEQSLKNHVPYHHEFRIVWADTSVHWVEGRGRAFYNETGQPVRMTGTIMAIDERKQAQLLLQQQFEQQHLITEMTRRVRQSLRLQEILQTTVDEVRQFLQIDRVIIFRFSPGWKGTVTVESVVDEAFAILPFDIYDPCIGEKYVEPFKQGLVTAKSDIYTADISPCHVEFLSQFQVRANLVVPILNDNELWGLLAAHHCQAPRQWQEHEISLLQQLASQVGIALQQAALLEQVQTELNERKQAETALRQSETRLRLAQAVSNSAVWDWDLQTNTLFWSPEYYQLYGLHPNTEPTFKNWLSCVHPDDRGWVDQKMIQALGEVNSELRVEFRVVRLGKIHWFANIGQVYQSANGEPTRIIGITIDITEQKQTEVALQALNNDLEQRVTERTEELTHLNDRLLLTLEEQQQAKQEIEDLYNNAPCGYHSLDAQGTIVRINNTELSWLGYTREEILYKKNFLNLLSNQSQQIFLENFPKFKRQGWIDNLEFQMLTKNGLSRWFNLSSTAVWNEAGDFLMSRSTLFNIDDRKQAEFALQQQVRQRQLLWNITQAIRQSLNLEVILQSAVEEVRQLLAVDRVAVYRFNSDWSGDFIVESVSEQWVKLVDPNFCRVWEDSYLQETQGGRFQYYETLTVSDVYTANLQPCHIQLLEQFQARAYAIAPIFVQNVLWGLFAIYQNSAPHNWATWEVEILRQIASQLAIAIQQSGLYSQLQVELQERQQAAVVLREAERRWRFLLDNVQLIVVGLDQSGSVNYVNSFFLTLTGYEESEVVGQNWFEKFLPTTSQPLARSILTNSLAKNPSHQNSILMQSGEERLIAWNNTILQDSDGTSVGSISIGEDITERQKVEEIKNEFIGIVSHELRTPLTAIQMSLGLLNTGVYAKKPERTQRMIEIALQDTNRLVNLVNDILDLERLESGRAVLEKTACQAADLMQQAVDGVQAIAIQQNITLAISPATAIVWAAPDTIVQTLTNLLSNAIKFSPSNSVIRLQVKPQDCPSPSIATELAPELSQEYVLFQISDQGRGIPADKLETIFGRFQQVDASDSREKGGTGLGLPICRSIIERHNGKIWAESILGQGSTFFFTLPVPPDDRI